MKGKLIERYIIGAIVPYFLLAVILLTAILVTQQSAKFAEVLGAGGRAPWYWAFEIMFAVLPNVLIFTLPMAMLIGTATGFSRLGSEGELTAMKANGVGDVRILAPVLMLSIVLTAFTVYVGFEYAPFAARQLRDVSSRAALYRLESPVEPRTFYTELPGKVIYVRDGDEAEGVWGRVFIQWDDKEFLRLITAATGHIDTSGEQAELVLNDATITTIPKGINSDLTGSLHLMSERSILFRIRDDRLNSTRNSIIKKIRERQPELDEMSWRQLSLAGSETNLTSKSRDAVIAFHKRLSLCFAPIAFAFLGVGLGNRTGRGGRVFAVGLSLCVMIAYYLITLVGEQSARTGLIKPFVGLWTSFILSLCIGIFLICKRHITFKSPILFFSRTPHRTDLLPGGRGNRRFRLLVLLDWMMLRNLLIFFNYAFLVMLSIFMIFTVFELLRFVVFNHNNYGSLYRYILYLLPFVGVTIAPLATLISVLVTFVLLDRRGELNAWWASGESIYRLMVPVLAFALGIGALQFLVQEKVLPYSNQRQNTLRSQIRGGQSRTKAPTGAQWLAGPEMSEIYSFNYTEAGDSIENLTIYQFDESQTQLARILYGDQAEWVSPTKIELASSTIIELGDGTHPILQKEQATSIKIKDRAQFLNPSLNNPGELDIRDLSIHIKALKTRGENYKVQVLTTALERKRSDPCAPLVMTLIGAPLALAFGRKGMLSSLFVAVLAGLLFWGATSGMQLLGNNGYLAARWAAWGTPVAFALMGAFLLSKSRT